MKSIIKRWYFATAEHRDLLSGTPQKYAPRYGGFCAWAAAQGKFAPGDPNVYKVVDTFAAPNPAPSPARGFRREAAGRAGRGLQGPLSIPSTSLRMSFGVAQDSFEES